MKQVMLYFSIIRKLITIENFKRAWTLLCTEGLYSIFLKVESIYYKSILVEKPVWKLYTESHTITDKIELPIFTDVLVSIVIPVYNNFDFTFNCAKAVLDATHSVSYELIIADDSSDDNTKNSQDIIKNCVYVRNKMERGFIGNCNNAANYAKGKYIVFLNNDTNVQNHWLDYMLCTMEGDPGIGIVGAKLIYPNGKLQEAGGIIWNDGSACNYGNHMNPVSFQYNYIKDVDYISGACMLIRSSLWKELGGFEQKFSPAYYEDADICFAARKKGYRVVYQPQTVVVHFEGVSNGKQTTLGFKRYQTVNKSKFALKWAEELKMQSPPGIDVFWARDRSRFKRTLVFIDHYIPEFDKDAGSQTADMLLHAFVKMGFKIILLGDNCMKKEPYATRYQQIGVEVLYGEDVFARWKYILKKYGRYIDWVFICRPHIAQKYLGTVRRYSAARIAYYGEDLHFLRLQREFEVCQAPILLQQSQKSKRVEIGVIENSDISFYLADFEVDAIHELLPVANVKIIPPRVFSNVSTDAFFFDTKSDLLFVGGFSHKPNVDGILWFANEVFPIIIQKNKNIRLIIVGSNMPSEVIALENERVVVKGFVESEVLTELYKKVRVFIAPLRYGAGVKCKILEAMSFGVPVITTDVGAEGIVDPYASLVIANSAVEFAARTADLYNDYNALQEISLAERKSIIENYTNDSLMAVLDQFLL